MRKYLRGWGRLSHLIGPSPAPKDPKFNVQDEEDSMIMFGFVTQCNLKSAELACFSKPLEKFGKPFAKPTPR